MTKSEFMTRLTDELCRRNVPDAEEIAEEYRQHFVCKAADGYTEEEIARKLGDPALLAAQFLPENTPTEKKDNHPLSRIGLGCAAFFGGILYLLLAAWGVVMAVTALTSLTLALCLLVRANPGGLIPAMPYGCGVLLALTLGASALLFGVATRYYAAFLRQLPRAFGRFRYNVLAASRGKTPLPALPLHPRLPAPLARRLRTVAWAAVAVFACSFIITYIVCSLTAGSLEFWHAWGWFQN